jgi:23S rRNA pseudouridine1911/1915/1917 synthase
MTILIKLICTGKTIERLDKFIVSKKLEELYSRSYIEKLILNGHITVNGKAVKKSHVLRENDGIEINIPITDDAKDIKPMQMDISVLYEDDYLAVVDKPAGISVHPAKGNYENTLANGLVYHFGECLSEGYEALRPGIVHRLDKDTTGVLLIAKTNKIQSQLSTMFQNREISKKYQAITVGVPAEKEALIETNYGRHTTDRKKMAVLTEGKRAVTRYKIITEYRYFSHLDIELITGRTHQIRVHFAHLSCPVLGDTTYANISRMINSVPGHLQKKVKSLLENHLKRQALHAYQIEFIHPVFKKVIQVESFLPPDMQYTLSWLKENFNEY